jgi:leucyl aminopeptidase (aminopeptidase T)
VLDYFSLMEEESPMKKRMLLAVGVMLSTGLLIISLAGGALRQTATTDYDKLAASLVQSAAVKEGDIVMITGSVRDAQLMEDVAVNVRKMGAHPLITIGSDRLTRRMYVDVDAKYDSQAPKLDLKLFEMVDAIISVDVGETEGLLADIAPERFRARTDAGRPVGELIRKRNVRSVNLGNGLYPTATLSKRFGVAQDELSKIFWNGVNVNYTELQATAEKVRAVVAGGKEVRITNPNGTDLRVQIAGRPVFVSDGVISADDMKRGYAGSQIWLPAGEVFLTPVPGTANGTVVVDRQISEGKVIEGLTFNFKDGKLTSMTAKNGDISRIKTIYDKAPAGKENFALIDLGINRSVQIPKGSNMVAWMPAGMVTIGFGGFDWAGGDDVGYAFTSFLPGSTVEIDGMKIVENGALSSKF